MTAGPLEAVLWDMDGLLVDTEPLWTAAEHELAARFDGTFTPEMKAAVVGTRLDVAVPTLLRMLGAPTDEQTVHLTSAQLLARVAELFAGELPPRPGALRLLEAVAAAGVPQALVSSSFRLLVDAVLGHGYGPFDVTVAGDEVREGKPAPEPYLTAAARLGVRPERCVVLEDSAAGAAAGVAAGCAVVLVPDVAVPDLPPARGRVVSSLEELDVAALQQLAGLPA